MQDYIFDVILILVSGSACLYCYLLNKKLKNLQDMKKGLGASIITLSKAVSATNQAAHEAKMSAAESAEHLRSLLKEVEVSIPKMDMMLETMELATKRTETETRQLQKELVETLRPLLDEAHKRADELSTVMHQADHQEATDKKDANPFRRKAS